MTHIEPLNFEKEFSKFKGDNVSVLHTLCRTMYHKLNEVIWDYEHLKEVVLCRQLESNKSDTASNQSNTEPKIPSPSDSNTKITVKCKLCGKERDGIHLTCNCPRTISLDSELPQKIRLLADFAGYPAGEYKLKWTSIGWVTAYFQERDWISDYTPKIHPDIIKSASWQGIRSEVTDGEESVDRQLEKKCICRKWRIENEDWIDEECPKCTPQTEPIESPIEEENIY